jgi:uncharacterized protein (DUF2267 family)
MQYREMIKKMQTNTGFSDKESEQSLRLFIETLATRLTDGERKDMASQLPSELQDLAMAPSHQDSSKANNDFIGQFCEMQEIDEGRAKKQIMGAWETLKQALTPGEVKDIQSQMPKNLATLLH